MILSINANTFDSNYIIFQETKINNMIDGNFTKFFYSPNYMIMTGIYIKIPVDVKETNESPEIKNVHFANTQKNLEILNSICEIEVSILNLFKTNLNKRKIPALNIKELFNYRIIKITNEPHSIYNKLYVKPKPRRHNFTYTYLPLKDKQQYSSSVINEKNDNKSKSKSKSKLKSKSKSIYSYNVEINTNSSINNYVKIVPKTYVIKISGIWENSVSFGLTYKILECG